MLLVVALLDIGDPAQKHAQRPLFTFAARPRLDVRFSKLFQLVLANVLGGGVRPSTGSSATVSPVHTVTRSAHCVRANARVGQTLSQSTFSSAILAVVD